MDWTTLAVAGMSLVGTLAGTFGGNAGNYPADTNIEVKINDADLEAASFGDGLKIIKVFVKNAAGTWSTV